MHDILLKSDITHIMDWKRKRNTFYNYGLDTVTWFMETLPGGEQAVVCNNTISGFVISLKGAVIYWVLKASYS